MLETATPQRREKKAPFGIVLIGLVVSAVLPAIAVAEVTPGSSYRVAAENLPGNWGWETVTFDGVAEPVDDGQVMINEREAVRPEGIWTEFSVERVDGQPFTNPGPGRRIRFEAQELVHDAPRLWKPEVGSWYLYYTIDGDPVPFEEAPDGDLRPHPFDPTVADVWFTDNLGGGANPVPFLDGATLNGFSLGNQLPEGTTGLHLGALFQEIPDPDTGFEFDLLALEITGQNAFSDDFEDGLRDASPTAVLVDLQGKTTEAGGALVFRDSDGTSTPFPDAVRDLTLFDRIFRDGGGSAEISATVAPFAPTSLQQALGLMLDRKGQLPIALSIEWNNPDIPYTTPCGSGLQATLRSHLRPMRGEVLGCDSIDPASVTGDIVLRVVLDDENDELRVSYSTDGGQSFINGSDFGMAAAARPILREAETARLFVAGSGVTVSQDLDGDGLSWDLCPETIDELNPELGLGWVPNRDGDLKDDACDPCPDFSVNDGLFLDSDGNGIGDNCECGDQNEDGTVDVLDIIAINNWLFGFGFQSPLCDADNSGACTPNDILAVNLKIYGQEGGCARYPNP